ncbi:MAG: lanthionine synthetase LanC family protein [Aequorivita sp.]
MNIMEIKNTDIRYIISKIEKELSSNDKIFYKNGNEVGISNGVLGLSLFYYYYYLLTKEEWCIEKIMKYFNVSINSINSEYKGSFIILDIIEIVHFFYFLKDKGLITENINEYCKFYDPWVNQFLDIKLSENDLDPYGGIVRAGVYWIQRSEDIDIYAYLNKILSCIERQIIHENDNELYFDYRFYVNENRNAIEYGKGHGMAGIIYFLLRVYKKGMFQQRCYKLLIPALEFLSNKKYQVGINLFPFDLNETQKLNYSNLAYGDLGIAYTFYHAGEILQQEKFKRIGVDTMKNIAKFTDDESRKIFDASLLYGAAGIYSIFKLFDGYNKDISFEEASNYWFNKIVDFGNNDTTWAGYNTYHNGYLEYLQLNFQQGICGIGITMICKELNIPLDYLKFLDYNFI